MEMQGKNQCSDVSSVQKGIWVAVRVLMFLTEYWTSEV